MAVVGLLVVERVRVAARPVEPLRPDLAVRASAADRNIFAVPDEEVAADVVREDRRKFVLEYVSAEVLRDKYVAYVPERTRAVARLVIDLHAPHSAGLHAVHHAVAAPAIDPPHDLQKYTVHSIIIVRVVAGVHCPIYFDDLGAGRLQGPCITGRRQEAAQKGCPQHGSLPRGQRRATFRNASGRAPTTLPQVACACNQLRNAALTLKTCAAGAGSLFAHTSRLAPRALV